MYDVCMYIPESFKKSNSISYQFFNDSRTHETFKCLKACHALSFTAYSKVKL